MGDVNHKYPNTTIPSTIIVIAIIPIVFALFMNARTVIVISRKYSNASHAVKPICSTSSSIDLSFCFHCNKKVPNYKSGTFIE